MWITRGRGRTAQLAYEALEFCDSVAEAGGFIDGGVIPGQGQGVREAGRGRYDEDTPQSGIIYLIYTEACLGGDERGGKKGGKGKHTSPSWMQRWQGRFRSH